jgi:hypothetical protein
MTPSKALETLGDGTWLEEVGYRGIISLAPSCLSLYFLGAPPTFPPPQCFARVHGAKQTWAEPTNNTSQNKFSIKLFPQTFWS